MSVLQQHGVWGYAPDESEVELCVTAYQASRQSGLLSSMLEDFWRPRRRTMHLVLACDLSEPEPNLSHVHEDMRKHFRVPGNQFRLRRVQHPERLPQPLSECLHLVERRFSVASRADVDEHSVIQGAAWHY